MTMHEIPIIRDTDRTSIFMDTIERSSRYDVSYATSFMYLLKDRMPDLESVVYYGTSKRIQKFLDNEIKAVRIEEPTYSWINNIEGVSPHWEWWETVYTHKAKIKPEETQRYSELGYKIKSSPFEDDDKGLVQKAEKTVDVLIGFLPKDNRSNTFMVGHRGSGLALEQLAVEMREFCQQPDGRIMMFSGQSWDSNPDMDEEIKKTTWDDVILPSEQKEEIQHSIEQFFKSKEKYDNLGVNWKRGLLFVGAPGVGKTMTFKAIANESEVPVLYVRDVSGHMGAEHAFGEIFKRARKLSPCIILMEDLDGMVNDLTRSVFLNEMDGFYPNSGILVLASSNHPEDIDDALLKRPSRFDRVFSIRLPGKDEKFRYALQFLSQKSILDNVADDFDLEAFAKDISENTPNLGINFIKEAFIYSMLELAHRGKTVIDEEYYELVMEHNKKMIETIKEMKDPSKQDQVGKAPAGNFGFGV